MHREDIVWEPTWVPSFKPVKSRVVPEGTARAERMMVEHCVLETLARDAPSELENVHVATRLLRSRSSSFAGAVICGSGTGPARTW